MQLPSAFCIIQSLLALLEDTKISGILGKVYNWRISGSDSHFSSGYQSTQASVPNCASILQPNASSKIKVICRPWNIKEQILSSQLLVNVLERVYSDFDSSRTSNIGSTNNACASATRIRQPPDMSFVAWSSIVFKLSKYAFSISAFSISAFSVLKIH